ncbi:MAG: hypothetical protein IAE93_03650 [Ignavibacteria bacterium]|nr:hypothetical protein [Ignavibacteria bacterium]
MKTLTLLFYLVFITSLLSQTDSAVTFGLPEMRIKQTEKGKVVTYEFDNSLNKFTVTPGFLYPDTNKYRYKVKLNDINSVSFKNGTNVWSAAGVTGAVGFVLGFFAGGYFTLHGTPKFNFNNALAGGLFFAVPFAIVGGVVGLLIPRYEDYDVKKIPAKHKYEALKRIFLKHHQKR